MIDTIWVGVLVFFFLILSLVLIEILASISVGFSSIGLEFFSGYEKLRDSLGYFFLGIYFGIPIAGIVASYLVGSEPIFLIPAVSFLIISVLIFGILKATSIELIKALPNTFNFVANNKILSYALDYYPFIMFLFGIGILLAQFLRGYSLE